MSSPASLLPADALPAATCLAGTQYQVDSLLGRGGFGLTYLCAEPALLRWVAIKELFPPGATRNGANVVAPRGVSSEVWSKSKRAFETEARRLATFADPCVVRVYAVWEENNTAYMAMEALDGGSLAAHLRSGGPMSPERVAKLGIALCRALTLLHGANLLHRDLKPDNIFFAPDESPVLIDFGNARGLVAQQTQTTSLALTPGYAPPEAYASRAVFSPASDIYSLGATLWECLSASPPPDATDRVLGAPLPTLLELVPGCSPLLAATLERALELKPEARFGSASEFSHQLERALEAAQNFSVKPVFDIAPSPPPAAPQPVTLPWTTTPTAPTCAHCGRPVKILDSICPNCGAHKNGYVPGEFLRRDAEINRSWMIWKWVFTLALGFTLVVVGGVRAGRSLRSIPSSASGSSSSNADQYADTNTKLRLQSTELRRSLRGSRWALSVRPQFSRGSIDIVATPDWQKLSRDDRLEIAKGWANSWRNARAPLPAPFQITDANGRVLGGRSTGALEPWLG